MMIKSLRPVLLALASLVAANSIFFLARHSSCSPFGQCELTVSIPLKRPSIPSYQDFIGITNNRRAALGKASSPAIDKHDGSNSNYQMQQKSTTNIKQPPRFELPPGRKARLKAYNAHWMIISSHLNLMVTFIPKVMCSSIRKALNKQRKLSAGIGPAGEVRAPYLKKQRLNETVDVSTMTRVVVLRDPFERVLSTYHNSATNKYIRVNRKCPTRKVCTLQQWLTEIAADTTMAFKNEHFVPQADIAQMDYMHYHYILRMSSDIDQQFLWTELLKSDPHKENMSKLSSVASVKDKWDEINDATLQLILKIYQDDLDLWESALQRGTPREPGEEYTMYDYYKEHLETKNPHNNNQ